jgi:hypothetical protein
MIYDVLRAARIAAAYKDMTVPDYVSAMVLAGANRDIEASYQARAGMPAPKGRGRKGEQ